MLTLQPAPPGIELVKELQRKDADARWLLSMLHMIRPEHEFFSFEY